MGSYWMGNVHEEKNLSQITYTKKEVRFQYGLFLSQTLE